MALEKQMEMFEDGGLMDEGGTIDPVSGNNVPPGSTQEEVRDDIPAQLSEGEFVFPADVVRYIGLEKLMQMRQQAKMGLQTMDDMGQMGNSEEAVMPDNLPFELTDLDMDDDLEYNVGGFVPQTGVTTQPSMFQSYAQQLPEPKPFVPQVYQTPTFTPTTQTTTQQQQQQPYTFQQLIPAAGGQQETKEYRNEAGQSLFIPFVNNEPVYPIPEGYTEYKPEQTTTPTVQTTPTQTQTTRVTQEDDGSVVGGKSIQEIRQGISETKDRYAITGSRGFNALTALGLLQNPIGTILSKAAQDLIPSSLQESDVVKKLNEAATFGRKDPNLTDLDIEDAEMGGNYILAAREDLKNKIGVPITGYVGTQKGDLDPSTGGFFNEDGRAVKVINSPGSRDDGDTVNATTANGNRSFASFSDWKDAMSTSVKTGWQGGLISSSTYDSLSDKGKANYDNYIEKTGGPLNNAQKEKQPVVTASAAANKKSQEDKKADKTVRDYADSKAGKAAEQSARDEGLNTGGLASKKKSKPKKMRSGGLASKK